MSSPEKKMKRRTKNTKRSLQQSLVLPPTTESTPNSSLPDDLLLSCFARVSRLYHPTLSLGSKSFRSLLASPELYHARSLLDHTECCLYVCLQFTPDSNPRWFTLGRKPDRALTDDTKKKPSGYVLAPIPIPDSPQALREGVVAVGSNIYNIGSSFYKVPSSSVSVLDCQSHTWHKAPNMRVERSYPAANVFNGKIYVAGGCEDCNASNWMEVFDPKTQIWESVLSPLAAERCKSEIYRSAVIGERIYMFGSKGVAYKPKEDKWEAIGDRYSDLAWSEISYCVIGDVLYCYNKLNGMKWYDSKIRRWVDLEGVLMFDFYSLVKLVDYGGKMMVLWDEYLPGNRHEKTKICCAVIALERRNSEEIWRNVEIWGNVEWRDVVLTVPISYEFVCAVAATV